MRTYWVTGLSTLLLIALLSACGGAADTPTESTIDAPTVTEDNENNKNEVEEIQIDEPMKDDEPLSVAVMDMLTSGHYTMTYRFVDESVAESQDTNFNETTWTTIVSNGETVLITETAVGISRAVHKGDTLYTIDDKNEMMIISPITDPVVAASEGIDFLELKGTEYIENGEGEFLGSPMTYELYSSTIGDMEFFFDGDVFKGIQIAAEDAAIFMEVQSLSTEVDESQFEIPEGYHEMEMDLEDLPGMED